MEAESFVRLGRFAEEQLVKDPNYENTAGLLAGLLLSTIKQEASWTVLEPVEITSAGGETLRKREESSIRTILSL